MRQYKLITFFLILAAITVFADERELHAAKTVIKVALITPEGSTWTNTLYKMAAEVERETNGEVKFKIYAGGISGDELDVLRKMRVNRIHAAGFSGVGLGVLVPSIRILEAPLLFKDYREIDFVKEKMFDEFAGQFAKQGYVLLGFAEAGFVYFFSKINISSPDGLKRAKMWVWKGDPVAETFLDTFGIKTYPLHLTDVNTGLETGMIDSFYSPTLAAIAFQWHSRVQYMLDYPMVNSTGALLLKKGIYDKLSEKNKTILSMTAKKYCNELIRLTRRDNTDARELMKEYGIEFLQPTKEQIVLFEKNAKKAYDKNMPALYSRELFEKVESIVKTYRTAHSSLK